jgi:hypothetical protein
MRALLFQDTGTRLLLLSSSCNYLLLPCLLLIFVLRTRLYVVWHNLQGTNIELDAYFFVSAGGCGILEAFDDVD